MQVMETVTQAEDQFSNYTVGETEHSVNGIDRGSYLYGKVNHEQNTGQSGSLWKTFKWINIGIWNAILSENVPSESARAYQDFVNHCCSGGPRNPHTARAMKGCIEWPRGIPKHGLKSKLLEARIESQKSQLRNVLKYLNSWRM
ncbi:hypothetical protein HAX54_049114 [Datura stramonium]|uniref:Transposase n=1 Tax=Datura stramonium TaxID=4076 RepID=A0ABS8WMR3_DATST|nr:hypothetical protein [Datura stramonium]